MLKLLRCNNYRSLEDVQLSFDKMTALIGPNGAGKTAALRAIDMLLGDQWPSLRSIRVPYDFTNYDATLPLRIELWFDPPLTGFDRHLKRELPIFGLRGTCEGYKRRVNGRDLGELHFDIDLLDESGAQIMAAAAPLQKGRRPSFLPLTLSAGVRDSARVIFIDHRRSILQHLPTNRGSVLARLFDPIRRDFEKQIDGADSTRDLFKQSTMRRWMPCERRL